MAYSYKGSISFGLVYIPVTLHSTIKNNDIGFNMIDKKTMSRVKYKKTCADCDGREVRQEDIVKGYEYEEGKYVLFDEKDFEKLKSKKDKNITIEQFVNLAEIDPLYFDKPYYVAPTGAEKAFAVLLSAMEEEGKAAVAKTPGALRAGRGLGPRHGPAEQPVFAVDGAGLLGLAEEGAVRAGVDGDVLPAAQGQDLQGVGAGMGERDVPRHRGDCADIQPGGLEGGQQGYGVVDSGVAVDDDGPLVHESTSLPWGDGGQGRRAAGAE